MTQALLFDSLGDAMEITQSKLPESESLIVARQWAPVMVIARLGFFYGGYQLEKLCECGCGGKTRGRFMHGHWAKTREGKDKLRSVRFTGKPSKHGDGYLTISCEGIGHKLQHRVIAEKVLGKSLLQKACIHHLNGIRSQNIHGNLVICEDRGYHALLHQRERALIECGHASWRKCTFCGQYDDPKNLYIPPVRGTIEHRRCGNEYRKNQMARRKA